MGVYGLLRASCREYYTSEALAAIPDISWTINVNVISLEQAANPGDGSYICTSKDLVKAFGDTTHGLEAMSCFIHPESNAYTLQDESNSLSMPKNLQIRHSSQLKIDSDPKQPENFTRS